MNRRKIARAWTAALLLAPVLAHAQTLGGAAWDGDVFAALKARLSEVRAPAAPAPGPAAPATRPSDPDADLRALFARPLIAGASVSAGYRAESPGRRAARKLGTEGAVVSVAAPGASGASMVTRLTDEKLAAATIVVGVDFFFWDSRRDCESGLAAVDDLFRRLAVHKTPAVIGNVPGGDCADKLNERIAKACASAPCAVLDLKTQYEQARQGGADLDGRHYTLAELQPDGLHLSDAGSELMARAVLDAARSSIARKSN